VLVRLVLWSLADSDATIEHLRTHLREESVDQFQQVPEAAEQTVPSRARELIGKDPEILELFDLEATVSVSPQLRELGLAFE
jgi:hypothetical protein